MSFQTFYFLTITFCSFRSPTQILLPTFSFLVTFDFWLMSNDCYSFSLFIIHFKSLLIFFPFFLCHTASHYPWISLNPSNFQLHSCNWALLEKGIYCTGWTNFKFITTNSFNSLILIAYQLCGRHGLSAWSVFVNKKYKNPFLHRAYILVRGKIS